MKLSIGFSPCPNDTFIFDAMIHHKIDTEGLEWEVLMEDVEALNQKAFRHQLDITKLSYHAYAYVSENYQLLNSGSALGYNCGPLLIARQKMDEAAINQATIAIPGKFTTAAFLLALAFPDAKHLREKLFSEIEKTILDGEVKAGLIIHENRFTYLAKGLVKLLDLGEFWERKTGMPIPLGGIVVSRKLHEDIRQKIDRVLRKSVQYAFDNPNDSMSFVRQHAQEMDEEVMLQHINLYVNNYSLALGEQGRAAVQTLYSLAKEARIIPEIPQDIFLKE